MYSHRCIYIATSVKHPLTCGEHRMRHAVRLQLRADELQVYPELAENDGLGRPSP